MSLGADELSHLYDRERRRLECQVQRSVGCRATAADIVHDIFLRLWERADSWAGNPAAFLNRAARNAAVDHLRAERVRRSHAEQAPPDADEAAAPLERIAARQDMERLHAAIAGLPERTRQIFLLNRVEQVSFREIALRCGLSERGVARHMARAVETCAAALREADDEA